MSFKLINIINLKDIYNYFNARIFEQDLNIHNRETLRNANAEGNSHVSRFILQSLYFLLLSSACRCPIETHLNNARS